MNDYERVARIIRHLDERQRTQPSLAELAALAGLSESQLRRLFHRWAGVAPKDFLQCLTAEFVKDRLRKSASVLDASFDAGLSGPGRAHDLLVALEAASPGEFKSRGAGMTVHWGYAESPLGRCSIGWNARGICHVGFDDQRPDDGEPLRLADDWSAARRLRDDRAAQAHCAALFNSSAGERTGLRAFVRGTPFQVTVWRALLRIPPGCVASYRRLARAIGQPGAARAVGHACGRNPVAILIPCHRVIQETGIVHGYHWGTTRKRALLARESTASAA